MIRAEEVVVDGFGHAHHTAVIAHGLHILVDFVAGIHGVVAAVIEKVANVMLLKDLQNALVIGVIHSGVRHLIAAGAKRRGGGILQQLQFVRIFQPHIEKAIFQNALNTMLCSQYLCDEIRFQCGVDHTVSTGIDHSGGAAGLANDTGAFQFFHW